MAISQKKIASLIINQYPKPITNEHHETVLTCMDIVEFLVEIDIYHSYDHFFDGKTDQHKYKMQYILKELNNKHKSLLMRYMSIITAKYKNIENDAPPHQGVQIVRRHSINERVYKLPQILRETHVRRRSCCCQVYNLFRIAEAN